MPFLLAPQLMQGYRAVFNDFGKDFACVDATGEQPQTGMIVHVEEVSYLKLVIDDADAVLGRGCAGDLLGRDETWTRRRRLRYILRDQRDGSAERVRAEKGDHEG